MGETKFADSVVWSFHQYRAIRRVIWDTFAPPIDSTIVDTIAFDFVESTTGAHELHRLLPDSDAIWASVYPFQPGVPDTGRMYRYHPVRPDGTGSTHLLYQAYGVQYDIALKQNIGATQVRTGIIYVTEGTEWAQHDLIAQTILQVPDDRHPALPEVFSLAQNYPNPFNPSTMITYELLKPSVVMLNVYDLLGREVSLLVNERKDAGVHHATFDASQLSSGVYFYRLQAGGFIDTKKMLVLR